VTSLTLIHRGRTLGPLTLSFGIAGFPENGRTTEAILEAADTALLKAKREGRDRVIRAEPQRVAEEPSEHTDLEFA
jgi:GGDEF domain-containing protein